MAFNEDSSASGHDEPWIQWFCGLKGHEMFCEVERSYIEDGFNLYGLRACVSNFSDCLDLILDRIGPDDSDDSHLTQSACTLYGLIHARYIITAHGLDAMYNKYAAKDFGTCPLVQCGGQPVLPVGLKDEMGSDSIKIFCPKCNQVYHPPPVRSRAGNASGVDGAAFGTTFPHLFLMTFSNLVPDPLPVESAYVPRVFGFRVHKSSTRQQRGSLPGLVSSSANQQQPQHQPLEPHPQGASTTQPLEQDTPSPQAQQQPAASAPQVLLKAAQDGDRTPPPPGGKDEEDDDASPAAAAASSLAKAAPAVEGMDGINQQQQVTVADPDNVLDGEDASRQPSQLGRSSSSSLRNKRRKEENGNGGGSSSHSSNLNVSGAAATEGKGTPSFLAENNSVKRRRRNNGST